jgi:hypothetical protein
MPAVVWTTVNEQGQRTFHNKPRWVKELERAGKVPVTQVPCKNPWWEV